MGKLKLEYCGSTELPQKIPPTAMKIRAFLHTAPLHKAYDATEIANIIAASRKHVQTVGNMVGDTYRFRRGRGYWYANPQTVKNQKEGKYDGS